MADGVHRVALPRTNWNRPVQEAVVEKAIVAAPEVKQSVAQTAPATRTWARDAPAERDNAGTRNAAFGAFGGTKREYMPSQVTQVHPAPYKVYIGAL